MSCEDLAKIKINKTQSWPLSSRLHRQWSCVVSFFLFKLRFQLIKETLEAPREIWAIFKMFIFLNGPVLWRHFWLRNLRSRQRVLNAGIFFCLDRADDMLRSQLADNISPLDVKQAAFSSSASPPPQPPPPVPGNPCSFQERHSHLKG